jgi:hypothetical protein
MLQISDVPANTNHSAVYITYTNLKLYVINGMLILNYILIPIHLF